MQILITIYLVKNNFSIILKFYQLYVMLKKSKQEIKQSNIKKYLIFFLPCYINKSAVRVPSVGTNLEIYKHKHLLENQEWREYINVVILK